jgi:hypothetical protein
MCTVCSYKKEIKTSDEVGDIYTKQNWIRPFTTIDGNLSIRDIYRQLPLHFASSFGLS